jgi:predicted RNA-binding protein YlxR (DUF448 family)
MRPARIKGVKATASLAEPREPDPSTEGAPDDAAATAASPRRRCIATGEGQDRARLLRFVVGPDGAIVPDIDERLPGRGLWLTPRRDIVERAVAKRAFARAARRSVAVPPDLADRVEILLARRCVDSLGLARRAGLAVAGFDRVCDAIRQGRAGLLLCARDGAAGGRRKLVELGRGLPCADILTAAELGAAFGRDRIVYAALGGGKLCRRLIADLDRLAGLRPALPEEPAAATIELRPENPAPQRDGTEAHD